jgi:hypothetical protein
MREREETRLRQETVMARSAAAAHADPRAAALLESQLKAWFDMLAARPVPSQLIRHLDLLDGRQVNGVKPRKPEVR